MINSMERGLEALSFNLFRGILTLIVIVLLRFLYLYFTILLLEQLDNLPYNIIKG